MTLAEALDALVSRTGHTRYRDLCDPDHPAFDPAWPALVIQLASDAPIAPAPARPTIAEVLGQWAREAAAMARSCCGRPAASTFDARQLPAAELALWPFDP